MNRQNKYGGIVDCEIMDKRTYELWYQMLRRCYDKEQQKRSRGKSYIGCTVSPRWMYLSNFALDIKSLDGYECWRDKVGYCLDKDTKVYGNKVYSKETCCFIPYAENIRDMNKRNPHVHRQQRTTQYILFNDKEKIYFNTEKDACAFLGVKPCTVSSCYRYSCKCKGYSIAKMRKEDEGK